MGETLLEKLLIAMRRVVPPDVVIEPTTPLDMTTLDSLGLLETFVHLEELTGERVDEETVRALALDADYAPSMTIEAFSHLLGERTGLGRSSDEGQSPAPAMTTGGSP